MEYDIYSALEPLGFPVVWGGFDDVDGYPRVTVQLVSGLTNYTHKGQSDVEMARIQVNVYALTYEDMMLAARQVSQALTTYRGGSVIRCRQLSRRDSGTESGGEQIRLQMLDFSVRYRA